MRLRILVILLALALLTAGCAAQNNQEPSTSAPATGSDVTELQTTELPETSTGTDPAGTAEATVSAEPETEPEPVTATEENPGLPENEAFTSLIGSCDSSILGMICNDPFPDGEPAPTVIWNEGEYDRLCVCPRYVGSVVSARRILRDESGGIVGVEDPAYTTVCENGTVIGAALERPEGGACWVVTVIAPNGAEDGYELEYNGRYGTLRYEFLTDPAASELYDELPQPEALGDLNDILGADVMQAFLRQAARMELNPWKAMRDYCAPFGDYGDAAAYTVSAGEMEGDTFYLEAVRLREGYDPGNGTPAERAAAQAELYAQIGNERGILGPDREGGEALYVDLKGITVYNPTLSARKVTVSVNGEVHSAWELEEKDFCTLIPLDVGDLPADVPVTVQIQVVETRGGDPADAILEVWTSLGGNISAAR